MKVKLRHYTHGVAERGLPCASAHKSAQHSIVSVMAMFHQSVCAFASRSSSVGVAYSLSYLNVHNFMHRLLPINLRLGQQL